MTRLQRRPRPVLAGMHVRLHGATWRDDATVPADDPRPTEDRSLSAAPPPGRALALADVSWSVRPARSTIVADQVADR